MNCSCAVTRPEQVETPYFQTSPMGGADCHWYVKSNQICDASHVPIYINSISPGHIWVGELCQLCAMAVRCRVTRAGQALGAGGTITKNQYNVESLICDYLLLSSTQVPRTRYQLTPVHHLVHTP